METYFEWLWRPFALNPLHCNGNCPAASTNAGLVHSRGSEAVRLIKIRAFVLGLCPYLGPESGAWKVLVDCHICITWSSRSLPRTQILLDLNGKLDSSAGDLRTRNLTRVIRIFQIYKHGARPGFHRAASRRWKENPSRCHSAVRRSGGNDHAGRRKGFCQGTTGST